MIPLYGRSVLMDTDETLQAIRPQLPDDGIPNYVNGLLVRPAPLGYMLPCMVAPLTGRELHLVPEGDRLTENLWLFCQVTTGFTMVAMNDLVLRNGNVYQCQVATDWGSYTQARIVRCTPDANAETLFGSQPGGM